MTLKKIVHNAKLLFISPNFVLSAMFALSLQNTAFAVDWDSVSGKEFKLYYPGQTGMEWMLDKRAHDGAARYKKRGKPCRECHEGEEFKFGARIVSGQYWEAAPLAKRRGTLSLDMKAAADANNLYVRLEWKDTDVVAGKKQDSDFQTKVTLMLGNEASPQFTQGGCWAVCHQDAKGMPEAKGDGVSKYLSVSRNSIVKKIGGGEDYKSSAELAKLAESGDFLEYWQAKLNPATPAKVLSGYILDKRHELDSTQVKADATLQNGNWVVEFSRPLKSSSQFEKDIKKGSVLTFGIGLHDQYTSGRFHLVTFEYTMSLGKSGDLQIKQL
jgi:cytochrome c-type protein NapC